MYRAIVLGFILIPVNAYWVIQTEFLRDYGFTIPTGISLFFNVVFIICILVLINALIKKAYPKLALRSGELLLIYYILCISSFMAGEEVMQTLVSLFGHAFWYATPENEWQAFHTYLPEWLTVRDKSTLEVFYESETTIHLTQYMEYFKGWLPAVLAWSLFLTILVFVMYCLNVILRKQWMDNERLTYPVVRLPLELIRDTGSLRFFRNKAVLAGISIAGLINLINGFSFFYPVIPSIPIKYQDIGRFFTEKPWNAIGWMPVSFYLFVIGLGFLIPLELSFSCWFFYVFYKMLLVFGKATGLAQSEIVFHPNEQILGAYMGVLVIALWNCRRYLINILSHIFRQSNTRDRDEPMRHRTAVLGVIIGFILLVAFSVMAGMTLWVAVLFFVLYFAISLSITRLRAELGAPAHDTWSIGSTGPDTFIAGTFGTRRLSPETLGMLTLYYGFNMDHRSHVMPHQLESLKVADALNLNWKWSSAATIMASLFGSIAAFWAIFHSCYKLDFLGRPYGAFERMQRWLFYPSAPDFLGLGFFGFGAAFTMILMAIRSRFIWFPFHPLGYALAPGWTMNLIWFPLFISWGAKLLILRYGGLKALRQSTPFFLGLILGDFIVGGSWTLVKIFLGIPTYSFWI